MKNESVDITFLHTGEVHVKTFTDLLVRHSPNLIVEHIVNSDFLEQAMQLGITETLKTKVANTLKSASESSKLVVCSCSTLGQIAEQTKLNNDQYAIRIDRAMADFAVTTGNKILVLAALQSTIKPTSYLMQTSQQINKTENQIDYFVVEDCWQYFLDGEYLQYEQTIADVISEKQSNYDCIVLAQASMAGASKLVEQNRALIISSPEIGVKNLISRLK